MSYITVKIDTDTAINMLVNRLDYWTENDTTKALFRQMYERYAESGVLDGIELEPGVLVDNDYINYCQVIDETDENFKAILEAYEAGDWDISCLDLGYSFIEAVSHDNQHILVRH